MEELQGVRAAATRDGVIAAALLEFSGSGFRGASVESIAERAGLSRATVYLHFSSKNELFRALVTQLHAQHLDAMRVALRRSDLDIEQRLVAVLEARFLRFVTLTSRSSKAAELYDAHSRLCGDIASTAEQHATELVAQLLSEAIAAGDFDLRPSGITADQLARALCDCALAAKGQDPASATAADFHDRLTLMVRVIIRGVGTQAH